LERSRRNSRSPFLFFLWNRTQGIASKVNDDDRAGGPGEGGMDDRAAPASRESEEGLGRVPVADRGLLLRPPAGSRPPGRVGMGRAGPAPRRRALLDARQGVRPAGAERPRRGRPHAGQSHPDLPRQRAADPVGAEREIPGPDADREQPDRARDEAAAGLTEKPESRIRNPGPPWFPAYS